MAELQHLTKPELIRLFEVARENNPRDWLMMLVAYWHGLRASELITLTTENIRDNYITVKRLKGSEKTTHELMHSDIDILNEKKYLNEYVRDTKGVLFPMTRFGFYAIMRKYGKKAGLPMHLSHPHVLKHSICKHVVDKVVITKLQKYVGHKNLNSTAAYTKPTDREACDAVRDAFLA